MYSIFCTKSGEIGSIPHPATLNRTIRTKMHGCMDGRDNIISKHLTGLEFTQFWNPASVTMVGAVPKSTYQVQLKCTPIECDWTGTLLEPNHNGFMHSCTLSVDKNTNLVWKPNISEIWAWHFGVLLYQFIYAFPNLLFLKYHLRDKK